nr:hypothetical protein [Oedogonium sp. 1_circle_47180]
MLCAVTKNSQGAQGLFVPCQLFRIFTESSISQSLCRRQRDSRYAIHAGRQLCAKEFRSKIRIQLTNGLYLYLAKNIYFPLSPSSISRKNLLKIFRKNLLIYF